MVDSFKQMMSKVTHFLKSNIDDFKRLTGTQDNKTIEIRLIFSIIFVVRYFLGWFMSMFPEFVQNLVRPWVGTGPAKLLDKIYLFLAFFLFFNHVVIRFAMAVGSYFEANDPASTATAEQKRKWATHISYVVFWYAVFNWIMPTGSMFLALILLAAMFFSDWFPHWQVDSEFKKYWKLNRRKYDASGERYQISRTNPQHPHGSYVNEEYPMLEWTRRLRKFMYKVEAENQDNQDEDEGTQAGDGHVRDVPSEEPNVVSDANDHVNPQNHQQHEGGGGFSMAGVGREDRHGQSPPRRHQRQHDQQDRHHFGPQHQGQGVQHGAGWLDEEDESKFHPPANHRDFREARDFALTQEEVIRQMAAERDSHHNPHPRNSSVAHSTVPSTTTFASASSSRDAAPVSTTPAATAPPEPFLSVALQQSPSQLSGIPSITNTQTAAIQRGTSGIGADSRRLTELLGTAKIGDDDEEEKEEKGAADAEDSSSNSSRSSETKGGSRGSKSSEKEGTRVERKAARAKKRAERAAKQEAKTQIQAKALNSSKGRQVNAPASKSSDVDGDTSTTARPSTTRIPLGTMGPETAETAAARLRDESLSIDSANDSTNALVSKSTPRTTQPIFLDPSQLTASAEARAAKARSPESVASTGTGNSLLTPNMLLPTDGQQDGSETVPQKASPSDVPAPSSNPQLVRRPSRQAPPRPTPEEEAEREAALAAKAAVAGTTGTAAAGTALAADPATGTRAEAAQREVPHVSAKPSSSGSEKELVRKDSGLLVQGTFPEVWQEKTVDKKGNLVDSSDDLQSVPQQKGLLRNTREQLQALAEQNESTAKAQKSSSDAD